MAGVLMNPMRTAKGKTRGLRSHDRLINQKTASNPNKIVGGFI